MSRALAAISLMFMADMELGLRQPIIISTTVDLMELADKYCQSTFTQHSLHQHGKLFPAHTTRISLAQLKYTVPGITLTDNLRMHQTHLQLCLM